MTDPAPTSTDADGLPDDPALDLDAEAGDQDLDDEISTADAAETAAQQARPATTIPCTSCGEPLLEGARFCEACGTSVGDGMVTTPLGVQSEADTAGGGSGSGACVKCQSPVDAEGYCTMCGHKAIEPVTVDDRDLLAFATHRGRRHDRNEDAAALGATSEGWPILVVSDGVSVSPNPHLASAAAVLAASDRLAGRPFTGDADLAAAIDDAHAAASGVPVEGDPNWLVDDGTRPACTIVIAVATSDQLHVANVGDARVHLLTERDPASGSGLWAGWQATQLTTDDSAVAQAVAEGIDVETALTLPGGHAITAWLGADAPSVTPHLATCPLAAGDVVLATSDGLWNYAATDGALSDLATDTLPPPGEILGPPGLGARCEQLVSWAVDQGGADNVTVAVAPAPATVASREQRHPEQEEPA